MKIKNIVRIKALIAMIITMAAVTALISGCPYSNYDPLEIMPEVANLADINTIYNEYNSAGPPYYGIDGYFLYSTDVGSAGDNFDIWLGYCSVYLSEAEDLPDFAAAPSACYKVRPFGGIAVNGEGNEYGPFLFFPQWDRDQLYGESVLDWPPETDSETCSLFYASDSGGAGLDIYRLNDTGGTDVLNINVPDADDGYLCYAADIGVCLFCSDRDGDFDIYTMADVSDFTFPDSLLDVDSTPAVSAVNVLNTEYDEKCPYVFGDILVFVSNRHDEHNNFDIYYSHYSGGAWQVPARFPDLYTSVSGNEYSGPMISEEENSRFTEYSSNGPPANLIMNTDYDEYRPFLFRGYAGGTAHFDSEPYGMLFSSNRPGGKGGFDLYLALIPGELLD